MRNHVILLFYGLYALAHYYVGMRLIALFQLARSQELFLWLGLTLTASAFFLSRQITFSKNAANFFLKIGAYWLGIFYYLLLLTLLGDLLLYANKILFFLPAPLLTDSRQSGLLLLFFLAFLIAWGTYQARSLKIASYHLTIPKASKSFSSLHIVFAADLHLGSLTSARQLKKFIDSIKNLDPDLILLGGDIIDGDAAACTAMIPQLRQLSPHYGIYTILGNHEYLNGQADCILSLLKECNISVLRDETITIANSVLLAGRDDRISSAFTGKKRITPAALLATADKALPIILLDHQPAKLEEAQQAGVDLQLSGHTHHGQLFPNNLITSKLFEVDWGYLRKETLQILVTCGYGTWGPPLRIGSHCELIDLTIEFTDPPAPPA